jgi:Kelch motif
MPTARTALAGATTPCPTGADGLTGTCVYAIGGKNGSEQSTVEAYSPAANTWATMPSTPTASSTVVPAEA